MIHYPWKREITIKKKMICRAKHVQDNPLLVSLSAEYEDTVEWDKQVQYWYKKYWHHLTGRHTLVQCQHVTTLNGDIVPMATTKIYVFPREQLSPLSCDEVDALLGLEVQISA